ncbi:hypothetical protein MPHLCCUG_01901 [Mycolicibacterium phlei]|nr:hypothetical protein MPHLCCUG_01901 [Mycolicibacterium phlei]
MSVDAESTPLLAMVSEKGHHIGAADDRNFEFGLECILERAERLIEDNAENKSAKKTRKR